VLENQRIGAGARVGAGALVTHDVEPGVPARPWKAEKVRAEDW